MPRLPKRGWINQLNGAEHYSVNEKWKQQLINLSLGCPDIDALIRKSNYTEKTLALIVKKINGCKGAAPEKEQIVIVEEKKKAKIGIMTMAFVNSTDLQVAESPFAGFQFGGGITYEIFSRKKPERVSFYNEFRYQSVDQEGVIYYTFPMKITFSVQSLRLAHMLRNTYHKRKMALFWNLGISNGYRTSAKLTLPSGRQLDQSSLGKGYEKGGIETGLLFGFGNRFKVGGSSITLEGRFEFEQGIFDSSDFYRSTNVGLFAGFQF